MAFQELVETKRLLNIKRENNYCVRTTSFIRFVKTKLLPFDDYDIRLNHRIFNIFNYFFELRFS